jgi:cytochrome d ubiquinol oxidase subunit II
LTPFALGTAIGGIASGRVPVGNAQGDLVTSWLNPMSVLIGVLAVVSAAYLAAVFLSADAARQGDPWLTRSFRSRALVAGLVAGATAVGGLAIVHHDARDLFDGLTEGAGLVALVGSVAAGLATLALIVRSRFEPARYTAALAVTAIVAGWGLAQSPNILPGMTVHQAAAGDSTLIPLLVGLALGAFILIPSLAVLFGLTLSGRFDRVTAAIPPLPIDERQAPVRLTAGPPLALVGAGSLVLIAATASWLQVAGAVSMLGGLAALFPMLIAIGEDDE